MKLNPSKHLLEELNATVHLRQVLRLWLSWAWVLIKQVRNYICSCVQGTYVCRAPKISSSSLALMRNHCNCLSSFTLFCTSICPRSKPIHGCYKWYVIPYKFFSLQGIRLRMRSAHMDRSDHVMFRATSTSCQVADLSTQAAKFRWI